MFSSEERIAISSASPLDSPFDSRMELACLKVDEAFRACTKTARLARPNPKMSILVFQSPDTMYAFVDESGWPKCKRYSWPDARLRPA